MADQLIREIRHVYSIALHEREHFFTALTPLRIIFPIRLLPLKIYKNMLDTYRCQRGCARAGFELVHAYG
jgi:hypothetical protein